MQSYTYFAKLIKYLLYSYLYEALTLVFRGIFLRLDIVLSLKILTYRNLKEYLYLMCFVKWELLLMYSSNICVYKIHQNTWFCEMTIIKE